MSKIKLSEAFIKDRVKLALTEDLYPYGDITSNLLNKNEIITTLLSTKLFVGIGLISYSLYLWHYPIFAFAREINFFDGSIVKILTIGIIIIIASILSYYFIEKQFRTKKKKFRKIIKNNDFTLGKEVDVFENNIKKLLKHKDFDKENPNKLRSVLGTFQRENILLFHSRDFTGYEFVVEQISEVDKYNPQVASRLILPMTQFQNFNKELQDIIKSKLQKIYNQKISNDLSEILEKAIG